MKRVLALVCLAGCASSPPPPQKTAPLVEAPLPSPPVAKRVPHSQVIAGKTFDDDYFWLREKGTPDVVSYLQAENAYTEATLRPTAAFQQILYAEMLSRLQQTDSSVPYRDHGYFYYTRVIEGQQYPIRCRKSTKGAYPNDLIGASATAPEEVLLDPNLMAKTEKYVGVGPFRVSNDGKWLAVGIDTTGFREFTLRFRDLVTGAIATETIPRVDYVEWAADNKTVFYVQQDATTKRDARIYRHVVGTDPQKDVLVYEEKDERFDLDLQRSRSTAYLILTSQSKVSTEVRFVATAKPEAAWTLVEPRADDMKYEVDFHGNELVITTNAPETPGGKKAVNFRIATATVDKPGRAHWKQLVPHRPDVRIESVDVFATHAVLHERADALPRLLVLMLGGKKAATTMQPIAMPEPLYAILPEKNAEYETPAFRFQYQSPVTPATVYDYDIASKKLELRKRTEVKGYDAKRYEMQRITATAKDGVSVPISLVYKKGVQPDPAHPSPMLLYGYGSYGISIPLAFSSERFSLLDRGVVFAIAHIRGGGDLGKPWHDAGRMASKMNTFTDFIACAEALIAAGWTGSDRLAIQGASAGGLLMGAVVNLRPELWKAVVAQVPFVDVINTMFDETLPATVTEFEEWGNPKKPDELAVILAYSPYDNLQKREYPAMLVESSYNDSQVMYWEPAKYVAKLRALKTDKHPLLLKMRMEPAGHGGKAGRYEKLRDAAFTYGWVLTQLGITK